jgi:ABC-2 type transport system permease protein
MSSASLAARAPVLPPPGGKAGFGGALASEWTKIRSVRSTWWLIPMVVVGTLGISYLGARATYTDLLNNSDPRTFHAPNITGMLSGVLLGQLVIVVFGAIGIASEYSTGMIRTTLSVQPRRATVYFAKLAVLAVFCLVISEALSFIAFFIGNAVISPAGYAFSLSDSADLVAVFGAGLYLTGCALLAFGLGAFFRNTAAGIAVPLALLLVLEIIGGMMPQGVQDALLRYIPMEAGIQMLSTIHTPGHDLSAGHGFEVFFAWVLAAVLAGFWAFTRRDA